MMFLRDLQSKEWKMGLMIRYERERRKKGERERESFEQIRSHVEPVGSILGLNNSTSWEVNDVSASFATERMEDGMVIRCKHKK